MAAAKKLTARSVPGGYVPPVLGTARQKPAGGAGHPIATTHHQATPRPAGPKHKPARKATTTTAAATTPGQLPAAPADGGIDPYGGSAGGSGGGGGGGGFSDPYSGDAAASPPVTSGGKSKSSSPWWKWPLYIGGGVVGAGALYGYVKYRQVTWPIRWARRVYAAAQIVGR